MTADAQIIRILRQAHTAGGRIEWFEADDKPPGVERAIELGYLRDAGCGSWSVHDAAVLTNKGREIIGAPTTFLGRLTQLLRAH